ncbi:unnamed protein product [Blepharisma stoltei]|uniref:Uncharacterized protein n=1 Tax=Blepharisma stoltei TaxID=1481888 RepID=A0AAU9JSJ8_9CILI|nr:unnamed protein product [Blepharisma stoltei]
MEDLPIENIEDSSSDSNASFSSSDYKESRQNLKKNLITDIKEFKEHHKDCQENLSYLLQQAEKYANFLFYNDEETSEACEDTTKRKKSHKTPDNLYMADMSKQQRVIRISTQPSIIKNGQLRQYQIDGINWLISLFKAGINGILADEMGLGKTVQAIGFLAYLKEIEKIDGPHLIVVPKSTLGNWIIEFSKWCPSFRTVKLIAAKPYREEILKNELIPGKFDICVTSYEGIFICQNYLKKYKWKFLIIDEAHKIKNDESNLAQLLRQLHSDHRILITGTPLQNNLHELWSLMNFLLPDLFSSSSEFDEWFNLGTEEGLKTEEIENKNVKMVQQLHKILKPFILRRTKSEVEKGIPAKKEILVALNMTALQRDLYKKILTNELVKLDSKSHYLNVVMQLKKVCNHPFLFPGIEDQNTTNYFEGLVAHSGKMKLLDRLLLKLKENGSQVLIFSQMTMMLDIIEDYCSYKGYFYCRLDGSTDIYEREQMIEKFNMPGSEYFIFLLSTRAGGLGINLVSADTVILYDSDWNPQTDLQAMDRAHRIGQKKQVNVYRLVIKDSLEERIIERQCLRLKLDSLIIQTGRLAPKNAPLQKEELREMLHYGADQIFNATEENSDITEEDLVAILQRGEQHLQKIDQDLENQLDKKKMNLVDFESKIDMWNFESVDYSKKRKEDSKAAIELLMQDKILDDYKARRERKLYNTEPKLEILQGNKGKEFKPVPDYRFCQNRERLIDLQKKEFFKEINDEEKQELEKLLATGFEWNRKEYYSFLKGCELYGKEEYALISEVMGSKTMEEVKSYSEVFWQRLDELEEKEKILKLFEKRQSMVEKHKNSQKLLDQKYSQYKEPWKELKFHVLPSHKSKLYTEDNDRILVCMTKTVGYGNWEELKACLRRSPLLRFDYMLRSRTTSDLQRRVDSLIKLLEKEYEEKENNNGENQKVPSKRSKENNDEPKPRKIKKIKDAEIENNNEMQ